MSGGRLCPRAVGRCERHFHGSRRGPADPVSGARASALASVGQIQAGIGHGKLARATIAETFGALPASGGDEGWESAFGALARTHSAAAPMLDALATAERIESGK